MDEKILRAVIENSREGVAIVNTDFIAEYVNKKWCEILDMDEDELIGADVRTFHAKAARGAIEEWMAKGASGESSPLYSSIKLSSPHRESRMLDAEITYVHDSNDDLKMVVRVADITRREEEKRALEMSRARYKTLIETMHDGLSIDDENGLIVYANDAFCEMLGYDRSEILGKSWVMFTAGKDEGIAQNRMSLRRKGISERYELDWVRKDGRILSTIVSASPNFDSNGDFLGTFAIVTEISDQKEAEHRIQFYLDLLSHDIANQLQVIISSAGLLDVDLPESYVDDAKENIMLAVERCNRLITKVKRAGELRHLPISKEELTQTLMERIQVLERVHKADVETEGLDGPIMVLADQLLGELFWNLLENAVLHNPKDDKRVWVKCQKKGSVVQVVISDDGPGISDSRKSQLFAKSRRSGGVGLPLVKQMVEKYEGSISVEDRIKGDSSSGAKFTVTLNLANE